MNVHPLHAQAGGDDAHREAQDLLPWLANGSLAGTELERVQAHLQGCADCRADLAVLHMLRAAGDGSGPAPGAASAADPDAARALARLLPQLDEPAPAVQPGIQPDALAPVRGWGARLAANDGRWLRAAVAVQCGAIAVLAGLLLHRPGSAEGEAGAYRVLGAGPVAEGALVVTFRPDTPERELRRIVLDSGARVVGGPTVAGAWMLATAQAPAAVAARLRAQPAVTLAEPLGAEGRP